MIYTHGVNAVNGYSLDGFLYLTYFSDFDSTTGIDTPVVGSAIDYSQYISKGFTYTPDNLSYNGVRYPGVNITAPNADITGAEVYPGIQPPNETSFDIVFRYIDHSGYYGSFLWYDWFTVSPVGHITSSKFTLLVKKTFTCTNYNGAYTYNTDNTTTNIILPINLDTNTHLFSVVVNMTTRIARLYVDGTLYVSAVMDSGYNFAIDWQISPRYRTELFVSQLAVREGDWSINNGMNYPVPRKPYYPPILLS